MEVLIFLLHDAARRYGTCEIDWAQARFSLAYRLYVILIFVFNFFLPISVIVFTYVSIMRMVNASHRNSCGEVSERQKKIERAITQVGYPIISHSGEKSDILLGSSSPSLYNPSMACMAVCTSTNTNSLASSFKMILCNYVPLSFVPV